MSQQHPTSAPPAGWYADPTGQPLLRYWDGVAWTEHTQAVARTSEVDARNHDAAIKAAADQLTSALATFETTVELRRQELAAQEQQYAAAVAHARAELERAYAGIATVSHARQTVEMSIAAAPISSRAASRATKAIARARMLEQTMSQRPPGPGTGPASAPLR